MEKIKNIIPEGTQDFTIEECNKRRNIINIITSVFNKWGYEEISTPTIEYYDTFNHRTQSLREEEMYKFFDNNGRILVLRPDMTVPVARMVNTKFKDSDLPLKLYYCANVFRVHESLGGKRNEYVDCGIELIGLKSENSDLEVLVTALEVLKAIRNVEFKLEIGNVNILTSALKEMNLMQGDKKKILELINKKSLTNLSEYLNKIFICDEYKYFLNKIPWLFGDYEMIEKAKEVSFSDNITRNIEYLEKIYMSLKELGYENYITVDMSMVPRVNYYSGIIFKGYVSGIGSSVLRGGRYDNLLENFGKKRDAIGFAIDVNLLIKSYENSNNDSAELITAGNDNYIDSLKEAINKTRGGKKINIIYTS